MLEKWDRLAADVARGSKNFSTSLHLVIMIVMMVVVIMIMVVIMVIWVVVMKVMVVIMVLAGGDDNHVSKSHPLPLDQR